MIRFLICLALLFMALRAAVYGIYTFRDKNIAGGISMLALTLVILCASGAAMIDIVK